MATSYIQRTLLGLIIGLTGFGCGGGVGKAFRPTGDVHRFDNADWQFVLDTVVVDDGYAVRWDELKANAGGSRDALYRYVGLIGAVSPDNRPDLFPTDADRLAYWINAYNAVCMFRVLERNLPGNLIAGTATPIPGSIYLVDQTPVGGRGMTLDGIEKDKIRSTGDPRIHFAVNCASYSCPPLRTEAYTAARLDDQLDDQGRRYLNDPRAARLVDDDDTVALNSIFTEFYKGDFVTPYRETTGDKDADLLDALRPFAASGSPVHRAARYKSMSYDWSLNRPR